MKKAATLALASAIVLRLLLVISQRSAMAVDAQPSDKSASSAFAGQMDASSKLQDASGNAVEINIAPSKALMATLDNRRADIERMVSVAVSTTKIDAGQAQDFQNEIERLGLTEAQAAASGEELSFEEALPIAQRLDTLSSKIAASLSVPPLPPIALGEAGGKKARIAISAASALVVAEPGASVIFASLDATGTLIDSQGKTVGRLSTMPGAAQKPGESSATILGQQSLADLLSMRRAELERMVALGEASKKLTDEQAAAFRFELHVARNGQLEAASSDSVISFDEAVSLGKSLDELNISFSKALGVRLLPLVVKDTTGNYRLAINSYRGSVMPETASNAAPHVDKQPATALAESTEDRSAPKPGADTAGSDGEDDFAGALPVGRPEASSTPDTNQTKLSSLPPAANALPPTFNDADIVPIGTTAKLFIDYTPNNVPATWWAILESRSAQLEEVIAQSLAKRTIDSQEALELRTDLVRIMKSIAVTKSDPTPITMDHATVIAADLDRLARRVAEAASMPALPKLIADPDARLRIVLDNFGNIVTAESVRPIVFPITLDSRREQLENAIASALTSGKLAQPQATEFRRWLNRIAQAQRASGPADKFPYQKAIPLAVEMDLLSSRLSAVTNTYLPPLVVGLRFMLVADQVIILDPSSVRRAGIEARINLALLTGRLNGEQAAKLRAQLDQITSLESKLSPGSDAHEMMQILTAYDQLNDNLNRLKSSAQGQRTESSAPH